MQFFNDRAGAGGATGEEKYFLLFNHGEYYSGAKNFFKCLFFGGARIIPVMIADLLLYVRCLMYTAVANQLPAQAFSEPFARLLLVCYMFYYRFVTFGIKKAPKCTRHWGKKCFGTSLQTGGSRKRTMVRPLQLPAKFRPRLPAGN